MISDYLRSEIWSYKIIIFLRSQIISDSVSHHLKGQVNKSNQLQGFEILELSLWFLTSFVSKFSKLSDSWLSTLWSLTTHKELLE